MTIKPPFTKETALAKVKAAQDAWNSQDPQQIVLAYSEDSVWRNRTESFQGRKAIIDFLKSKWQNETQYKLMKELWSYTDNRISVRFEYEYYKQDSQQWYRTHGNEHWEFNSDGLMTRRDMSANDIEIKPENRKYH